MELVKPLAVHNSLGAPLTDDQKLLLEGGPPSKRLHWCMPLPCVAMIHFTDYQSFLQLCLLTFDQRFPFNTRKICLEREREKAHYGEINGSVFWRSWFYCPRSFGLSLPCSVAQWTCIMAFYGAWFILAWIIITTTRGIFNKTLFDGKCSHTKPFSKAQEMSAVFIKALPSEICFHRKWLSETGFERRCGMWEPAVPICFLPSDPWLCDCAVMTRP